MTKQNKSSIWNELVDLIDEHFPKGECTERGQALVFLAQVEMLVKKQEILSYGDGYADGAKLHQNSYKAGLEKAIDNLTVADINIRMADKINSERQRHEEEKEEYFKVVKAAEQSTCDIKMKVERQRIREEVEGYKDALIWCSGSEDFQLGGRAREGWEKICMTLLK